MLDHMRYLAVGLSMFALIVAAPSSVQAAGSCQDGAIEVYELCIAQGEPADLCYYNASIWYCNCEAIICVE